MFKPLKSVSVLLLLCAMPAAISYAASENGATSVNVTQQNGTCKGVVKDKAGEAVIVRGEKRNVSICGRPEND